MGISDNLKTEVSMSSNAGIDTQYGFEYQKEIFIFYAITKLAPYKSIIFEGRDDIEMADADKDVFHSVIFANELVQVKSGNICKNTFFKVICNWLLNTKDVKSEKFILVLENDFAFQNDYVDELIEFIKDGAELKSTSIRKLVYKKYNLNSKNDDCSLLKNDIAEIASKIKKQVFSMADLEKNILQEFSNIFCADILSNVAKQRRLRALKTLILDELREIIKCKKQYELEFSTLIKYCGEVKEQITDDKYLRLFDTFKKNSTIGSDVNKRVVQQLKLLGRNDAFMQSRITEMCFYEDLREFYVQAKASELNDLEGTAYANHENARIECELENNNRPLNVYSKTVQKSINSTLITGLPSTSYYKHGCYIYLTKDDIPKEKRITWGEDDE